MQVYFDSLKFSGPKCNLFNSKKQHDIPFLDGERKSEQNSAGEVNAEERGGGFFFFMYPGFSLVVRLALALLMLMQKGV